MTLRSWRTLPGQSWPAALPACPHQSSARQPGGVGHPLQQVEREFGNVLAALAERRHAQPHHVQAVEEILAERPAAISSCRSRAVVASTRTSIFDLGPAAVTHIRLFVQDARQPALQREGQVGHFLEQQACRHEPSRRRPTRAALRRRCRLGAEQFDLQPLRWQGRTVDDDERPVGALRPLVDQPRHRLLASAGGAGDRARDCR
jgi:hypothetical protein